MSISSGCSAISFGSWPALPGIRPILLPAVVVSAFSLRGRSAFAVIPGDSGGVVLVFQFDAVKNRGLLAGPSVAALVAAVLRVCRLLVSVARAFVGRLGGRRLGFAGRGWSQAAQLMAVFARVAVSLLGVAFAQWLRVLGVTWIVPGSLAARGSGRCCLCLAWRAVLLWPQIVFVALLGLFPPSSCYRS